jgi:glycine cleavage system H protein
MFEMGQAFGVVESVKAASDVVMPVDGQVVAVNDAAVDAPESLNTEPYTAWLIRVSMRNPSQVEKLMDAAAYEAYCETREH